MRLSCNICAHNSLIEIKKIENPDRFETFLNITGKKFKRVWSKCLNCNVHLNNMPQNNFKKLNSISDDYYQIDFEYESILEKFDKIINLENSKSDNSLRVERIYNFIHQNYFNLETILDVGSGLGVFPYKWLEYYNNQNFLLLEPDKIAYQHLIKKFNQNIIFKSLDEISESELKKVSLITLNKVLEHIENPIFFLKNLIEKFNNNPVIYIEVPDSSNLFFKQTDDNSLGSLHINLYDIQSMNFLAESLNLNILDQNTIIEPSGKITFFAFLNSHK